MKFPFFTFTVAALLAGVLTVQAGTAGIQDNAGFFSEPVKTDATWKIREVQNSFKKDICVETFKEIPADVKQGVNMADKTALHQMFEQWSLKRAREQKVNGVYILMVKNPTHLQANVGNETQKKAFTLADRDALVTMMIAKLHAKDNDGALRDGVSFMSTTMKSHATPHARSLSAPTAFHQNGQQQESSGGGGLGWLIPLLIVGVIVWVVLGIIRHLFSGGVTSGGSASNMMPGATGGVGGGGGGFLRNMMGGMFGAAAGMWMYDNFFGSHGSSAFGSTPDNNNGSDSSFSGQDTDYSSSGGSFGDDSNSSGDSGGGDFGGGGDSGGGGGDF